MINRAVLDGLIAAAIATGKILDPAACFVRLFSAGPTADGTVGADFTFPTPVAFNAQAITTWGAVQYLTDGRSCVAGPALTFVPASAADTATVIGFAVGDDSIMTNVKEYQLFPAPITMADQHHPVTVIPRFALAENASFDASVVIDG